MQRFLLSLTVGVIAMVACGVAQTTSKDPHAYFTTLSARADLWKSYSLRDPEQLALYRNVRKSPPAVMYDPASDTYPQKQDAAKIVILSDSLSNQVWLPIGLTGGSALFTWDAWYGQEYVTNRGTLGFHKAYQFSSPQDNSERLFEVRTRFGLAKPGMIADVDARSYWTGRTQDMIGASEQIVPRPGSFQIAPTVWTRYWVLWESVPGGADRWSMWLADVNRDAVQIYNRVPVDTKDEMVTKVRIEWNSSQTRDMTLGPLVAYIRNFVVLRNVDKPTSLFERPVAGPTLSRAPTAPANLRIQTSK